jgi:hypothetical protein
MGHVHVQGLSGGIRRTIEGVYPAYGEILGPFRIMRSSHGRTLMKPEMSSGRSASRLIRVPHHSQHCVFRLRLELTWDNQSAQATYYCTI